MPSLKRYDEKVPPHGGVMADGVRHLLGQPQLSDIDLLVREAMQNSWDARLPSARPKIVWNVNTVTPTLAAKLLEKFSGGPTCKGVSLKEALRSSPVMLSITDEQTKGLSGPTRADQYIVGAPQNFVSFIRNVGQHSGGAGSGGTYGFGKSSFFRNSLCGTALVYTRVKIPTGALESRFIACALGDRANDNPPRTGRAWWGTFRDDVIEPLLNATADAAARAFGVPLMSPGVTGTTVSVLCPAFGGDSKAIARSVSNAVLWHLWPKLVALGPSGLECEVWRDGTRVPISDPRQHPKLRWFVNAFVALREASPAQPITVHEIACQRPEQSLGSLAVCGPSLLLDPNTPDQDGDIIQGPLRHIALMRTPELVVSYLELEECPAEGVGYAGVFRADDAVNDAFAASEPPSHDQWNHDAIEDSDLRRWKTFVRVGTRRIRETVDSLLRGNISETETGLPAGAFGHLSQHLGSLLGDSTGNAPGPRPSGAGGRGGKAPAFRVDRHLRLERHGEHTYGVLGVDVQRGAVGAAIRATGNVAVAGGGTEKELPAGLSGVSCLGWREGGSKPGGIKVEGTDLELDSSRVGKWDVLFRIPDDAAVSVSVALLEER